MRFRWNDWNRGKIAKHGVRQAEAEQVVSGAANPYLQRSRDGRWLVRGRTSAGSVPQVIFLLDRDKTVFVIHARPLSPNERRRYNRRLP